VLIDEGGNSRLNAIAFGAIGKNLGEMLQQHSKLHLLGELKWNIWQGNASPQLIIEDAALI
jgi:hypothetical protein